MPAGGLPGLGLHAPAGLWWAAGINQVPLQIALAFGLTSFLSHLRTGRTRPLVASVLWVALGLLFCEKTIPSSGSTGWSPRLVQHREHAQRLRGLWDRYRTAVVVYAGLGAGYPGPSTRPSVWTSPGQTADVAWGPIAWNLVAVAMLPAMVGGPLAWQSLTVGSLADPPDAFMVASWAAVGARILRVAQSHHQQAGLGPVVLIHRRQRRPARLASGGDRRPRHRARVPRYQTEAAVVPCRCRARLPPCSAPPSRTPCVPDDAGGYGPPLVGAICVVVVALSAWSSVRVERWQDLAHLAYLDRVERA